MTTTMTGTAARIDEIADGIYRLSTPLPEHVVPGGFTFNQILVADEEPLLFHTGPRRMFPLVREAMARFMPPEKLRYVAFSHVESDECGALNDWLAVAPQAVPVCSRVAAMVSIGDLADLPPRPLADGETLSLGKHRLTWYDTPHLPHGWDAGYLMDETTRTLLCGDLFTQAGTGDVALTTSDVLGPSEAMRKGMDYFAHAPNTRTMLERFASLGPKTLACMHGSAWSGDGAALLRALADRLEVTS